MTSCVDQGLRMELILASGESVPVSACLLYTSRDPFAVHIDFHAALGDPTRWVFSRDLLARGLLQPSGRGDVWLWPSGAGRGAMLHLALSSPHGSAQLEAALPVVARWLERTYQLVPPGREADMLDLEGELARLLHGTG
ncbi:SsgA family sporulation/cell division regulator [Streptomyces mirabilis]|uniref:SsgA family sporulation/cell division regulator n=1 Tax=Streptomyces mirabilis TaxID=68239 RepID=UPI0036905B47